MQRVEMGSRVFAAVARGGSGVRSTQSLFVLDELRQWYSKRSPLWLCVRLVERVGVMPSSTLSRVHRGE